MKAQVDDPGHTVPFKKNLFVFNLLPEIILAKSVQGFFLTSLASSQYQWIRMKSCFHSVHGKFSLNLSWIFDIHRWSFPTISKLVSDLRKMYRAHCQSMILSKFAILRRRQGYQKKPQTDFAKTNYQVSKHLARKNLHVRLNLGCLIIPIHQTKNIECNVWCIKNRTKHSHKTLLSLVRYLMHQTLN